MKTDDLDVVYLVKQEGSNEELRYSLRTLKNLPHRKVWIFGDIPEWCQNIEARPMKQHGRSKWEKSNDSFIEACKEEELSENFILMNDDFFIMKPVGELDYFFCGTLAQRIRTLVGKYGTSSYSQMLRHTVDLLEANGKPTLNYALHLPMIFNKEKVLKLKEQFPDEVINRALYGNWYETGGKNRADCKIYQTYARPNPKIDFLSTTAGSFYGGLVGKSIKERFDIKSEYEQ